MTLSISPRLSTKKFSIVGRSKIYYIFSRSNWTYLQNIIREKNGQVLYDTLSMYDTLPFVMVVIICYDILIHYCNIFNTYITETI